MEVGKRPAAVFDVILFELASYDDVIHKAKIALSSLNTFTIMRAKVDPAFCNPSAILLKQYVSNGVMKLVFSSSS
jgi:hypothetical protein